MKSLEMNKFLEDVFGVDVNSSIQDSICVFCKSPAVEFTDEISQKEFEISGMCQSCQDSVFGAEGE